MGLLTSAWDGQRVSVLAGDPVMRTAQVHCIGLVGAPVDLAGVWDVSRRLAQWVAVEPEATEMLHAVSAPLVHSVAAVDRAPIWAAGLTERVAVLHEPLVVTLTVSAAEPVSEAPLHGAFAIFGPPRDFHQAHVSVPTLPNVVRVAKSLFV